MDLAATNEDGGTQKLNHIPEIVLKKRRSTEEWAARRRTQLAEKTNLKKKRADQTFIKKPEQFVQEYREKELDRVRMKNRVRVRKACPVEFESKLLFVIRLYGKIMHPTTKKVLHKLGLHRTFDGVFMKADQRSRDMLVRAEPYVAYGYPNLKSVRELILKKAQGRQNGQIVPLTDNNIVEEVLGKYGMICLEDLVHEIASVGPHFRDAKRFLLPFRLKKPGRNVLKKSKKPFDEGGDVGNRRELINELISEMN